MKNSRKLQKFIKVLNILRNSARKIRKMLEISGICEKFHFFRMKISMNSPVGANAPVRGCKAAAASSELAVRLAAREFIEIFIRKNETSHKFRKFLAFSEFF